ncbi:MAG: carotenoid oxygenase family protein [Candidatus Obscuribacterales bacterium]|nr:carotenoid oxygenase family protein [Candidatus Obscuribacterales bacterium]
MIYVAAYDDGVIISVVLDGNAQSSFLRILDARTVEELARAVIPELIPFGFHGQLFKHYLER